MGNLKYEKKVLTIFPDMQDFHGKKDVGIIGPELARTISQKHEFIVKSNVSKRYRNATLVYWVQKFYDSLNFYILLINKFFTERKSIAVICLYHASVRTVLLSTLAKIICANAFVYVKLDYNSQKNGAIFDSPNRFKRRIKTLQKRLFIAVVDYISVECMLSREKIIKCYPEIKSKLYVVMNCSIEQPNFGVSKNNTILFAGRLLSQQKNPHFLFELLSKINLGEWNVRICSGDVEALSDIASMYISKEQMQFVTFLGELDSRNLAAEYERAKILILPSVWEGSPLVISEALNFGVYPFTSEIDLTLELTDRFSWGSSAPVSEIETFVKKLKYTIKRLTDDFQPPQTLKAFVLNELKWDKQLSNLCEHITNHQKDN